MLDFSLVIYTQKSSSVFNRSLQTFSFFRNASAAGIDPRSFMKLFPLYDPADVVNTAAAWVRNTVWPWHQLIALPCIREMSERNNNSRGGDHRLIKKYIFFSLCSLIQRIRALQFHLLNNTNTIKQQQLQLLLLFLLILLLKLPNTY